MRDVHVFGFLLLAEENIKTLTSVAVGPEDLPEGQGGDGGTRVLHIATQKPKSYQAKTPPFHIYLGLPFARFLYIKSSS